MMTIENKIEELQTLLGIVEQQRNGACSENAKLAAQCFMLGKQITTLQNRIEELEKSVK